MLGINCSQPVPSFEQLGQMIHADDREEFMQVFQTAIAEALPIKSISASSAPMAQSATPKIAASQFSTKSGK